MNSRNLRLSLLAVLLVTAVGISFGLHARQTRAAPEAPEVFASPVNGGCYITAQNQCRLHIDPYTVNFTAGTRLELVQVMANGVTVYDYRTDVSNPPMGPTYTLSVVMQDFAAKCGETYRINVIGKANSDPNPLNMGSTAEFTCPSAVP